MEMCILHRLNTIIDTWNCNCAEFFFLQYIIRLDGRVVGIIHKSRYLLFISLGRLTVLIFHISRGSDIFLQFTYKPICILRATAL